MWFNLRLVICLCWCSSQTIGKTLHPRIIRQIEKSTANGKCTTPDNKSGSCINIKSCPALNGLLLTNGQDKNSINYLRKFQCGQLFEDNMPVVCCTNPLTSTSTSVTRKTTAVTTHMRISTTLSSKIVNYGECGLSEKSTSRVVGGTNATLGDWPWMVGLGYRTKNSENLDFKCGATLISNKWIITAAHCVKDIGNFELNTARLGDLDLDPDVKDGATPVDEEIDQIIPHPQYTNSPNPITNDIALLRLKNTVQFSSKSSSVGKLIEVLPNFEVEYIRPVCLLSGSEYRSDTFYDRRSPFIIGWGALEWRGASSSRLQEAMIRVVNNTECANIYATQRTAKIDHRTICAGGNGKDTCQGDSGGPLIFPVKHENENSGRYYLGGIVSFGIRCADPTYPGVYTRVAAFTDWISQTTGLQFN